MMAGLAAQLVGHLCAGTILHDCSTGPLQADTMHTLLAWADELGLPGRLLNVANILYSGLT